MSVSKRIISGSIATWIRIVIMFFSQLVLVPLYLAYWDVTTYGVWISIQAFVNIITLIEKGHHDYIGFEFLKTGDKDRISRTFWSALAMGGVLNFLQIALIVILISTPLLGNILSAKGEVGLELIKQATYSIITLIISWFVNISFSGLMERLLHPFGYYPRMAWWNVLRISVGAFAPVLALINGFGIFGTTVILVSFTTLINLFFYIDLFRILKKELIHYTTPSLKFGFYNLYRSLIVSLKSILDNLRQQGIRVIVSPFLGMQGLAVFTTIRTAANVTMQGLGTITSPVLPELMRFLNDKDQEKAEASFSIIWMVLVFFLTPGTLLLQIVIEPLYVYWTHGKLPFEPKLFALLSFGVLINSQAQPAMAIINGNNQLKSQFYISIISVITLLVGMFLLVPKMGLIGVGVVLLLVEILSAVCYKYEANKWLSKQGLIWPRVTALKTITSILISGISIIIIILTTSFYVKFAAVSIAFVLFALNANSFWKTLPKLMTDKLLGITFKNKV